VYGPEGGFYGHSNKYRIGGMSIDKFSTKLQEHLTHSRHVANSQWNDSKRRYDREVWSSVESYRGSKPSR
jgi:hypothetical protein